MKEQLQFRSDSGGFEANLIEVTNYLNSHRLFIAIAAFATAGIVGCWTFFLSTPKFKATSSVIYSYKPSNPLENDATAFWSREADVDNKLYVLSVFIDSDRFRTALAKEILEPDKLINKNEYADSAKHVIQRHLYNEGYRETESAAKYLGSLMNVVIDREKQVIRLASHTSDPLLSQALVNVGGSTLVKINFEIVLKEMNSVVEFIKTQVSQTKIDLFKLEETLSQYQQEEKILNVVDTGTQLDSIQLKSALAINDLKVQRASAEIWMKEIEKTIDEFKSNLKSGIDSPLYLMQLQSKLDILLYQRTLSKKDRDVASIDDDELSTNLDSTLSEFQKSLQSLQASRVTMNPWKYLTTLEGTMVEARQKHTKVVARLNAMEKISNSELERYNTLPAVFRKINQVRREILQTSNLYQQLNNKLQETKIKRAGMSNDLTILTYATEAGQAVDMAVWKKFIFSFLGGGLCLVLLLTLRYILIPTIRSRNDLQKAGVEVIAEIPYVRLSEKDTHVNTEAPLLLKWNLTSDEANAIRQARFSIEEKFTLHEYRSTGEARILTVCSANSKEGKTFVASNVAHALAVAQFKVLLLDLDILNSSVRNYFDVKAHAEGKGLEEEIYFERVPVNAYLDIVDIPKTDKNLSDLLETPLLGDYLNSMKSEYDVILIDTPPLRNSLEALIASRFSSGMIFVANQRGSLRHDVFKALDTLKENFDRRVFAVLNFSYDEVHSSRRRIKKSA